MTSPAALFVDDDAANLVVVRAALEGRFRVVTAASAAEAIELLRRETIGVVIADQRMPGVTGVELLERISHEHPDVVRILITAYSDLASAIAAINRGHVRRYLKKPWEPAELAAEVEQALDLHAMSARIRDLELRLRGTERVYAVGVIAASLAHEVNNPAAACAINLQAARGDLDELRERLTIEGASPGAFRSVDEIVASIDEAYDAIEQIQELTRASAVTTRDLGHRECDLADAVALTERLVRGELRSRAKVSFERPSGVRVRCAAGAVAQILSNLFINAAHAFASVGRRDGRIEVTVATEGDSIVVGVTDDGPGVPNEVRARLFTAFVTTKGSQGSGLGLAISRRVAEDAGGSLTLVEAPAGRGARFELRLPRAGSV